MTVLCLHFAGAGDSASKDVSTRPGGSQETGMHISQKPDSLQTSCTQGDLNSDSGMDESSRNKDSVGIGAFYEQDVSLPGTPVPDYTSNVSIERKVLHRTGVEIQRVNKLSGRLVDQLKWCWGALQRHAKAIGYKP